MTSKQTNSEQPLEHQAVDNPQETLVKESSPSQTTRTLKSPPALRQPTNIGPAFRRLDIFPKYFLL